MIQVKLNPQSKTCPSCGFPKDAGFPKNIKNEGACLCFYCYKINTTWVVKLFTLICLEELNTELDRHVTVSELQELMNSHHYNDGRRVFSYNAVKKNLYSYGRKGYRLVTHRKGKHRKKDGPGRPATVWAVSKKGIKFKKEYQDRYERGKPASMWNKNNPKNFGNKMFVFGYDEKADRIRLNGYHPWAFFLADCFKRPEFQTTGEHIIEKNPWNENRKDRKDRIFNYDRLSRRDARQSRDKAGRGLKLGLGVNVPFNHKNEK